ncbi:Early nodulin-like protein 1, partial [Bienertia sinuspersici]
MGVLDGYYAPIFFFVLLVVLHRVNCASVVVDGVTQWKDPTANIGDSIIFKHRNLYNLYIFRTKEAFSSCNFTQAIPLSNLNSTTYTWHPSRIGNYYFGFYNTTNIPCKQGQKLSIRIISITTTTPQPQPQPHSPAPAMQPPETPGSSGGVVSSSPAYPWPNQPREKEESGSASPGPTYTSVGISPAMPMPSTSIPFINSNPAVPLPTGEVDSATIRPLPTPATPTHPSQ